MENKIEYPFGIWLRTWRKKRGLSQEGLAKETGGICSAGYISLLERGGEVSQAGQITQPNILKVDALAKALNRPLGEGRKAAGYGADDIGEAPEETNLLLIYRNLPEQQQADLLLLAEALHGKYGQIADLPAPVKSEQDMMREQHSHVLHVIGE